MQKFKPPRPNPIVIEVCKYILPLWLRFREHLSIKVCGTQTNLSAFSKCKRAIVLLNHPDRQDPFVVSQLAKQMNEQFNCIVARECFDWDGGWRGWLFQSLGCFSVARGKADLHSAATTKKLLREGHRKLVVFPEAEITADDFKLHELHKGIFHIALSVQRELSNAHPAESDSTVFIIPAAIKFSLDLELGAAVSKALSKMEKKLGLSPNGNRNVGSRITAVVDAYLSRALAAYGIEKPEMTREKIAEFLAREILFGIARNQAIKLESLEGLAVIDQLYFIRNSISSNASKLKSVALAPKAFHCAGISKPSVNSDLERVERLLVLQRMLEHSSSDIQCCRMLDFIESELFGVITPKGWQSCVVQIGAAINVAEFQEQFKESQENEVECLSQLFSDKLQSLLLPQKKIHSELAS